MDLQMNKDNSADRRFDLKKFERLLTGNHMDALYRMLLPSGKYTYLSASTSSIFGYSPQEFYANPLLLSAIIHPDWKEYFADAWQKLLKGEVPDTYEYQIVHKTGETRWIHQRNLPEKESNGDVIAIDGMITDITESKKLESALQESEKRFYAIFYSSLDPIFIIDENRIVDCNKAAVEVLGFQSRDQLIHTHPSAISPPVQPDGVDSFDKTERLIKNVLQKGFERFEWEYKRADGKLFLAEVTLTEVKLQDRSIIYALWKDIHEKRDIQTALCESRSRFLEFARTSFDWVWEVDTQGIYTYVSPRVKDFLGYEADEVIGRTPFDFMPEEEAKRIREIFFDYAAGEMPFNFLENINIHRDGSGVVLETSGAPIYGAEGEFAGYRGTDRDITQSAYNREKLQKIAHQYKTVIETTKDGYWMNDAEGNLLEVNNSYCQMSGYTESELLSMKVSDIEAKESLEETVKHIDDIIKNGSDTFETVHRRRNGRAYDVEVTATFLMIEGGRFFVFVRDITQRKKNEKELQLSAKVFTTMTDGVVITDASQKIINANTAYCKNTGYSINELLGKKPSIMTSGWHDKAFYKNMWKHLEKDGHWQGEVTDRKKNGEVFTAETSIVAIKDREETITNYIAVSSDITLKKEQEKVINNMAYYDALTNLPNRTYFEEMFNNRIAYSKRQKKNLALLFIDLDNFKIINDTFGHLAGDKLLQNAAERLKCHTRDEDIVGRFGGDEFTILVEDFTSASDLAVLAGKIVEVFHQPFELNQNEFFSGASIGISTFPENGGSYHDLMRAADTAMYQAKSSGKGGYAFYSKTLGDTVSKRMELDINLRNALGNNEFHLVYQPKIDLLSNRVYGMEALLRWVNPNLGFIPPDQFIPVLEENGLIYTVGLWIIREALRDTKKFHDEGFNDLVVSINVSYLQLKNDLFLDDFRAIIDDVGLPRSFIELEITESQIMNNIEMALTRLLDITKCGVKIAVDDFGTGYSSLSYLKKLPIDTIKIDKSFVLDIDKDEDDRSIVQAIIALSKSLNKSVIAEGSETQTHIDTLRALGCTKVQGYFYSKPLLFDDFLTYVRGVPKPAP